MKNFNLKKYLSEGKLNEENYEPGRGWTNNFDYDGMLNLASMFDINTPMDILLKVSSDMEDVNYHRENSYLTDAIDAIKDGNKQEAFIAFRMLKKEIAKLQESEIKERKPIVKNTKMKKSELKEIIKSAMLEGDNYYEDSMDEAEEVDVEDNEEVDVDIEKDVKVDDEESEVDVDVTASMPGENEDVEEVQAMLMKAQQAATELGDDKLTDQIGNTITYFTRQHVSKVDTNESINESTVRRGNDGLINKLL